MADSNESAGTTDSAYRPDVCHGRLFLGCPVWACDRWKGSLFARRAPRREWLRQYSSVFKTVEGNSTFYALPDLDTARRWAESSSVGFRFALKIPRVISHEKRLANAGRETAAFLEIANILQSADRLGPSFLQLPPDFGPARFDALRDFLRSLPADLPWAVEVRHHDWFDRGPVENELDGLLRELGVDKVLFDSRPLYSKRPTDDAERESQSRKPKTPIRRTTTGAHPFLRIVGRNRVQDAQPWIDEWTPTIAGWLQSGLSPFVFAHAPDELFAPEFARRLHQSLKDHWPHLESLNPWPGETERANQVEQLSLF